MSDEPMGKRRPHEQHAQREELGSARRPQHRDEPERKPGETRTSDWRGSGVCGDRHTD
jgi:hypothetical protein